MAFMTACSGDGVPVTPTDVPEPGAVVESSGAVSASAGQSVCHAVKFELAIYWPTFDEGIQRIPCDVTGDLEGTVELVFFGPPTLFGKVSRATDADTRAYWEITGGVLGAREFQTTFRNQDFVVDRPGSPGTLFENIGTHKAFSGVRKANLTYKGTFDLLRPEQPGTHDYHGVICP
jgi:hypothetical protein